MLKMGESDITMSSMLKSVNFQILKGNIPQSPLEVNIMKAQQKKTIDFNCIISSIDNATNAIYFNQIISMRLLDTLQHL
jgi:hypothetical protein